MDINQSGQSPKAMRMENKGSARNDDQLFANWSKIGSIEANEIEDMNDIEDYELKPRSFKTNEDDMDDFERLPVKSADGKVHRVVTKDPTAKNQKNKMTPAKKKRMTKKKKKKRMATKKLQKPNNQKSVNKTRLCKHKKNC